MRFGDLQVIPVADGLDLRAARTTSPSRPTVPQVSEVTEFREVIVTYNRQSVLAADDRPGTQRTVPRVRRRRGRSHEHRRRPGDADPDPIDDDVVVLDENADEVLVRLDADPAPKPTPTLASTATSALLPGEDRGSSAEPDRRGWSTRPRPRWGGSPSRSDPDASHSAGESTDEQSSSPSTTRRRRTATADQALPGRRSRSANSARSARNWIA